MAFAQRPSLPWQLRTQTLATGRRTLLLGIVNLTPDSFSGDGLLTVQAEPNADRATAYALSLLDEGADILDLGAESTRPGSAAGSSQALSAGAEQDRLLPVLEAVHRERPHAVLSVDTYHAATARAAAAAGAEIVNDVSGLLWDPAMAQACAELGCGLVLMHTRGRPDAWKHQPSLPANAVIPLVQEGLSASLAAAQAAGLAPERLVLDPGYGFGKAGDANYALLHGQAALLAFGRPLLAGMSRKSFLGKTLASRLGQQEIPPQQRDHATLAACVAAILSGASLLRVHRVRPALEAAAVADAILAAGASAEF